VVDGVIVVLLSEYIKLSKLCIKFLAKLAASGANIEPILCELQRKEKPDTETKEVYKNILGSLRVKNLIDFRSETNLMSILGITN